MLISEQEVKKVDILWVDDQIDAYKYYVDELRSHGANVQISSSPADATQIASERQFDAILLDIKMPKKNGIDLLADIRLLQRHARYAFISSFYYIHSIANQLGKVKVDMRLDKSTLPDPGSPEVLAKFVQPVLRLANHKASRASFAGEDRHRALDKPFEVTYDEYVSLPMLQRLQLLSLARDEVKDVLKTEFEKGAIWLLFCGDATKPLARAMSPEQMLSNEEICKRAYEIDRAPYHFSAPVEVDDITMPGQWGTSCKTPDGLVNYPTVSLEFGKNRFCVHFDTGSAFTFFSCEELVNARLLNESHLVPGDGECSKGTYQYANFNIHGIMRDQESEASSTRGVSVKGHAVFGWDTSPFARLCGVGCNDFQKEKGHSVTDSSLCRHRLALVGRNLLTDNELCLLLDGEKRVTRLFLADPHGKKS